MVKAPHIAEKPYTIDDIVKFAGGSNDVVERLGVSRGSPWQWKKGQWPGIRDYYWDTLAEMAMQHSDVVLTAQDFFDANKMARAAVKVAATQPTAA